MMLAYRFNNAESQQRTARSELNQVIGLEFADNDSPSVDRSPVGRAEIAQHILFTAKNNFSVMRRNSPGALAEAQHIVGCAANRNALVVQFGALSFSWPQQISEGGSHRC